VTVVLPNYNGRELLRRFLAAVVRAAAAVTPAARVLVVDDASTDGSVELLRDEWPQVRVLVNERNVGFAATANRGVAEARSPFVFLLNTDAEPEPNALGPLLDVMRRRAAAGAVVPRILQTNAGGACESVVFGAFRRGLFRLEWHPELCESEGALPVLYATGAAAMLRRDVFLRLGGFDQLFAPFYWEDADLGYRMWRAGYQVLYEPRSRVLHHHPGVIVTAHSPAHASLMQDRNRFLFTWKNLDPWLLAQHFALLPAHVIASSLTGRGRLVVALAAALRALPRSLQSRRARARGLLSSRDILRSARPQEAARRGRP
jgi:GT2 family glycosyltransferase